MTGNLFGMMNPMKMFQSATNMAGGAAASGAGFFPMMGGGAQGFNPMTAMQQFASMPMQAASQFNQMANQALSSFGLVNPFSSMTNGLTNGMSNGMSSMTSTASNMGSGMAGMAGMANGFPGVMTGSASNSLALVPAGSQTTVTTTQSSTNMSQQKNCENALTALKTGRFHTNFDLFPCV